MAGSRRCPLLLLCLLACGARQSGSGTDDTGPKVLVQDSSIQIIDNADEPIPLEIRFAVGSDQLDSGAEGILDALSLFLIEYTDLEVIEVRGHADEPGSEEDNHELSVRRSIAVVDYLVESGVPTSRLRTVGLGKSRPAVHGAGEPARRQNRRVEFSIVRQRPSSD